MTQPSRRQFLKTSSAVVAAGTVAANLAVSRMAHAAGDDIIKIGLIGCGGRGTQACTQALSTPGAVKLVAMADAFSDRLQSSYQTIAKEMENKGKKDSVSVPMEARHTGFDGFQRVIDSDVDLVILATPPGFRPIHLTAAIKAGKHVFMEKPCAVDAPGVRMVLEATAEAKKKNLGIGVGLQRHHQLGYIETLKKLHDGAIGDIHTLRVYWNGDGVWVRPREKDQSEMAYQMRNWYYFNWLCGDHICEQHIHNLDVGNWVKNDYPVRANGMGGRQVRTGKDHGEIFDHHFVEFEFKDGSRMFSQCRHIPGCFNSVSEHAQGSKGTCDVGGHRITVPGGESWRFSGKGGGNPYQVEHDDLFASIRKGTPLNEGENGAKSSMTSILGRMATYSGKIVEWEEAINSKISLMPQTFSFDATPPVTPDAEGRYHIAVPGKEKVV